MPGKRSIIPYYGKPDLRIERIVVAIIKSRDLQNYFFDAFKMPLACKYLDISRPYFGHMDDVSKFLNLLYFRNPEKFRQFFEYILNEITEGMLLVSSEEPFDGFYRFLRELNTLGFNYTTFEGKVVLTVGHIKEDTEIRSELEKMLSKLNSQYPKMLQGAWSAFLSESTDKYRQTIISVRELIGKVLRQLAPKEKTRRNRVKQIIQSEREAELVDSVADTVVKLYNLQSKLHQELDYESTLFALKTTEHLLYFLLKRAGRNILS